MLYVETVAELTNMHERISSYLLPYLDSYSPLLQNEQMRHNTTP